MQDTIKPYELKPEELLEEGMAMIVNGLFRIGDERLQNRPEIASINAWSLANAIIEIADGFDQLADAKEKSKQITGGTYEQIE